MPEVSLNVSDGGQDFSVEADSLEEIAQLLKLAGISPVTQPDVPEIATDNNGAFDVDVDDEGSISIPTDENADYDYGINPTSRKGHEYNTDPYQYQGNAQIPVRYVPAKSGDNPLPLWREDAKPFASYLKEVERKGKHKIGRDPHDEDPDGLNDPEDDEDDFNLKEVEDSTFAQDNMRKSMSLKQACTIFANQEQNNAERIKTAALVIVSSPKAPYNLIVDAKKLLKMA